MNVSLTTELERYVSEKVATGLYQSASEVVREALRALREKEEYAQKKAALIGDLQAGDADLQAGRVSTKSANDILADVRKKKS